ncbi:hypothetical protein P692DRAFT_20825105 [Suillus brevipes Sb2]|nr:hypothetical protein P692DRAFT_20825105 [Suillus brevipes Sb2]
MFDERDSALQYVWYGLSQAPRRLDLNHIFGTVRSQLYQQVCSVNLQSLCTRKGIKGLWLPKIGYEKPQWQGVSVVRNVILLETWNPLCTGSKRRHSLLMEHPLCSLRYKIRVIPHRTQ